MKMNAFTRIIGLFFLTIFIFSCATTSPRQKLLVGKWIPVKVENANISEHKTAVVQPVVADTLNQTGTTDDLKREDKMNRLIQTEMRSTLQINADKTAVKYFRGKTVTATWKLKKKGTILSAKSPETGKKIELEIVRVNDTSVTMIERLPAGNLRITFRKEK